MTETSLPLTNRVFRQYSTMQERYRGLELSTLPRHFIVQPDKRRANLLALTIIDYCHPDHHEYPGVNVLWPRGVLLNMVVASLMSLQLQWGTTVAAVLAAWFTPTVGLGCHSLAVVGHYAYHLVDDLPTSDMESDGRRTPSIFNPPDSDAAAEECSSLNTDEHASVTTLNYSHLGRIHARTIEQVADWLRWIGKSLAIVNAIGIIVNSVFQYAGVYDNCHCDSNVSTWGFSDLFNIISPIQSDLDLARKARIGALVPALTSCTFFVGTIYL
ncbi:hypothetical protein HD554DRAFT_2311020 [Boletus coccyginus]|nr:hypothetical protein HD554DRAFT_2311020 [Boletus coccyginus]